MPIDKIDFKYSKWGIQSNFSTEEKTALELAAKTSFKVDEMVDRVNGVEQSAIEARQIVDTMRSEQENFVNDNEAVRDELLADNQELLNDLEASNTAFQASVDSSKTTFETNMNTALTNFQTSINASKTAYENSANELLTDYQEDMNESKVNFDSQLQGEVNDIITDANTQITGAINNAIDALIPDVAEAKVVDLLESGELTEAVNEAYVVPVVNSIQEVYINVKDKGLLGDGTTDDYPALSTLLTAIGSSKVNLAFPAGTYVLGTTVSFPANVSLTFFNEAVLSPLINKNVAIAGPINAGYFRIFSGEGTISGLKNVSPSWYGAKGNGSNDDAEAFQKALNSGIFIDIQRAGYRIGTTLTVPNNKYINGNGCTLWALNDIPILFDVPSTSQDIHFHDITVNGDTPNFTVFNVAGHRVWIKECMTYNVNKAVVSTGARLFISDCDFRCIVGLEVSGTNEVKSVTGCVIGATGIGVRLLGGAGIRITGCDIMGGNHNILIDPSNAVVASLVISNTFFDQGLENCVTISHSGSGGVVRTKFSNCWFVGSDNGRGLRMNGSIKGLQINNCDFYANFSDAILINAASSGVVINSCNIAGNGGSGITAQGGASDFIINGNIIAPTADFGANSNGIYLNAGAGDNIIITNNRLNGNNGSALVDLATGTNKMFKNNIGYVTSNAGTASFSGNGSTTVFTISHGLSLTPKSVNVLGMNALSIAPFYVTFNSTTITITFSTAPATGTNNLQFSWSASN